MKVKNYIIATAAALAGTSTATPAPIAKPNPNPETENIELSKRDNWASCTISNCGFPDSNGNAEIRITTGGQWANDWGSNLLWNLRQQCGGNSAIYGWGFDYDNGDNSRTGHAHFWAYSGNVCNYNNGCSSGNSWCSSNCIENAIWLTSESSGAIWNLHCLV